MIVVEGMRNESKEKPITKSLVSELGNKFPENSLTNYREYINEFVIGTGMSDSEKIQVLINNGYDYGSAWKIIMNDDTFCVEKENGEGYVVDEKNFGEGRVSVNKANNNKYYVWLNRTMYEVFDNMESIIEFASSKWSSQQTSKDIKERFLRTFKNVFNKDISKYIFPEDKGENMAENFKSDGMEFERMNKPIYDKPPDSYNYTPMNNYWNDQTANDVFRRDYMERAELMMGKLSEMERSRYGISIQFYNFYDVPIYYMSLDSNFRIVGEGDIVELQPSNKNYNRGANVYASTTQDEHISVLHVQNTSITELNTPSYNISDPEMTIRMLQLEKANIVRSINHGPTQQQFPTALDILDQKSYYFNETDTVYIPEGGILIGKTPEILLSMAMRFKGLNDLKTHLAENNNKTTHLLSSIGTKISIVKLTNSIHNYYIADGPSLKRGVGAIPNANIGIKEVMAAYPDIQIPKDTRILSNPNYDIFFIGRESIGSYHDIETDEPQTNIRKDPRRTIDTPDIIQKGQKRQTKKVQQSYHNALIAIRKPIRFNAQEHTLGPDIPKPRYVPQLLSCGIGIIGGDDWKNFYSRALKVHQYNILNMHIAIREEISHQKSKIQREQLEREYKLKEIEFKKSTVLKSVTASITTVALSIAIQLINKGVNK